MISLQFFIYNYLVLPLIWLGAHLAAPFHAKLRENLRARREFHFVTPNLAADGAPPLVWFHCASLGEYEALVPVLQELHRRKLCRVWLTFFSRSGFANFQDSELVVRVSYAPLDFRGDVRKFLDALRPRVFVVTKHDLWPNTLLELKRRGIPALYINANFHSASRRLRPLVRSFNAAFMGTFHRIIPVNAEAAKRFRLLLPEFPGLLPPGETRYDRVVQRLQEQRDTYSWLPPEFSRGKVLVAGSVWPADNERLLAPSLAQLAQRDDLRLILVPHEPHPHQAPELLRQCREAGWEAVLYSKLAAGGVFSGERILIVDAVGLLAGLYRVASLAFVGGGFTTGVHSVIEPAVFGVPVLFGPRHQVSAEAAALLSAGGAWAVHTTGEVERLLQKLLDDENLLATAGAAAQSVIQSRTGTTKRIAELLAQILRERK
jgi:3-deoxy-D-manno-octulosonic-acid transferase